MASPIDGAFQQNFQVDNLPKNSAAFYDSKGFMENEVRILATSISMLQKGLEEGLKQIQDAINGLS